MSSYFDEITSENIIEYINGFSQLIQSSFFNSVKGYRLFLHLIGITSTVLLVKFGIDWYYFLLFRRYGWLNLFFFPAVAIGALVPLFLPLFVYLYSKKKEIPQLEPIAYALTQSAVVGLFWSSLYKAVTGRIGPEFDEFHWGYPDYSTNFAFGFLRRGVFDGWPSGHTTIAWAMATVVYFYQFDRKELNDKLSWIIKYRKYAFFYSFYIGLGVSTNIHWLSDAIAGMLIGLTIGFSVNDTFEKNWKREKLKEMTSSKNYWILLVLFVIIIFSIIKFEDFF